jgi:hypothetical protein
MSYVVLEYLNPALVMLVVKLDLFVFVFCKQKLLGPSLLYHGSGDDTCNFHAGG